VQPGGGGGGTHKNLDTKDAQEEIKNALFPRANIVKQKWGKIREKFGNGSSGGGGHSKNSIFKRVQEKKNAARMEPCIT